MHSTEKDWQKCYEYPPWCLEKFKFAFGCQIIRRCRLPTKPNSPFRSNQERNLRWNRMEPRIVSQPSCGILSLIHLSFSPAVLHRFIFHVYHSITEMSTTKARLPFRRRKLGKKGARNVISSERMTTNPIAKTNRSTEAAVERESGTTRTTAQCPELCINGMREREEEEEGLHFHDYGRVE